MAPLVVVASVLNLREGPGTSHRVLTRLMKDELVEALSAAETNGWRKVRATRRDAVVTGWVSAKYVSEPVVATAKPPKWLEVAQREIGVKEYPGPQHNPRIVEYATHTSLGAKSDEVAWCSSFVNWCMAQAELEGTGSAAARSWLTWGVDLKQPVPGCVAVFKRGADPAQGHVAFYVSHTDRTVNVLGGNQSNQVKIAPYKAENRLSYRWPKGVAVPGGR